MNVKQYSPTFFDMFEKKTFDFSTIEELFSLSFVIMWSNRKGFSGLAISDEHLIATYYNGNKWYAIGTLSDPEKVDLPVWERNVPGKTV